MISSNELVKMFFTDLKKFNSTNYRAIPEADLTEDSATVHKSFSSVLTRYFIFKERHPELSDVELNMLYFKLKLDLVAKYFSEYPDTTTDNLIGFQLELKNFIKESKEDKYNESTS